MENRIHLEQKEQQEYTDRWVLVIVDPQNDFIDGSLAVSEGGEIIQPLNEIIAAVRAAGGEVVFTRDWHPEDTPHFNTWVVHCVAGTKGAAFHPDLDVREEDAIISKGTEQRDGYSGWEGVGEDGATLETLLAPQSPNERVHVMIGGLATDYCVKATALDILRHFKDDERVAAYLLRDAIRAVNLQPGDGDEACQAMLDARAVALTCQEAKELIERTAL